MSISFTVDAGPLSQVGLEIASLSTAVQLATGAYGWFKGKERSRSLNQLLSSKGGELATTSSFDLAFYKHVREQSGPMKGALVQDRKIISLKLPKASTAVPDHPGIACLRALTTGLLCLCKPEDTVGILQNVIPHSLIQHHQDDTDFEIDGALLASLNQWVTTVSTEEDSNPMREHLLLEVESRLLQLDGVSLNEIVTRDYVDASDLTLMMGLVRWILTPLHRREPSQYPTRSLKAWSMALILGELGFSVSASGTIVRESVLFDQIIDARIPFGSRPDVFLVTTNAGYTDQMTVNEFPKVNAYALRPQPTLLRAVPWLAFRHLRGVAAGATIQYLVDIWNYSFKKARSFFRKLEIKSMHVRVVLNIRDEIDHIPDYHRALISEFSPHLTRLCGPAMDRYWPSPSRALARQPAEVMERMKNLRTEDDVQDDISENCYVLLAIILGSLYGICSSVCIDEQSPLGEDSQIAFSADLIYTSNCRWLINMAKMVGYCLYTGIPFEEWANLIFRLFLSTEFGTNLRPTPSDYSNRQNPYPSRLILGAQANGHAAISKALVIPTIHLSSMGYFHIAYGQVLNYPLTEGGFIQASDYLPLSETLPLDPDPEITTLCRFEDPSYTDDMRLDVEPCWEDDPRTVIFRLREGGVTIALLNIFMIMDRLAYNMTHCACEDSSTNERVSVAKAARWQQITLHQLRRPTYKGGSLTRADVKDCNCLIDASHSEIATAYALAMLDARPLLLTENCLRCGISPYHEHHGQQRGGLELEDRAVVIIWKPEESLRAEDSQSKKSKR